MKNLILLFLLIVVCKSVSQTYVLDTSFGNNGRLNIYDVASLHGSYRDSFRVNDDYYFFQNYAFTKTNLNGTAVNRYLLTSPIPYPGTCYTNHVRYINNSFYSVGMSYTQFSEKNIYIDKRDLNGNLDTNFGTNGYAIIDFGSNEFGNDLILANDGNLLCTGTMGPESSNTKKPIVFKINAATGSLITQLNGNSFTQYESNIAGTGDFNDSYLLNFNGNYLLAACDYKDGNSYLSLINIDTNGSILPTFGINGYKTTLISTYRVAFKNLILNNEKVYCNYQYYISNYWRNGDLLGFDVNSGQLIFNITGGSFTSSFKVYDDGIYTTEISGNTYMAATDKFYVSKRLFNGQLDPTFHINGTFSYDTPTFTGGLGNGEQNGLDEAQQLFKLDTGDIMVGGWSTYVISPTPLVPVSYNGETVLRFTEGVLSTDSNTVGKPVLYPNPFEDQLNITAVGITKVSLFDMTGRNIKSQEFESPNNNIALDFSKSLSSGIYLIQIFTVNNTMYIERIIKK